MPERRRSKAASVRRTTEKTIMNLDLIMAKTTEERKATVERKMMMM